MNNYFIKKYFILFQFIAVKRIENKDLSQRVIHSHLVCVLATSLLMWAYAVLAYTTIDNPVAGIVGFAASLIHLISPLYFRISNNRNIATNIFLGAGLIHQATFAYFSGGFLSNIIIWFGILPLLAGIVCGRKGVIQWVAVTSIVSLIFCILQALQFSFPIGISKMGLLFAQGLVVFGWIYVGAFVVWIYLLLLEHHELEIEQKGQRNQDLICVITHDISNPLTVIMGRANSLKKECTSDTALASIAKLSNAVDNIIKIVNNVRNLYASELGKKSVELEDVELIGVFKKLEDNYSDKLISKNLVLHYNFSNKEYWIRTNEDVLLFQILSNVVSNAIKFSHENNQIEISINQDKDFTIIQIIDSGIGIPQEILPNIFNFDQKTSRRGTSGESGTGFGLPIVKSYVEMLGGTISVSSITSSDHNLISGTTFTLKFKNSFLN